MNSMWCEKKLKNKKEVKKEKNKQTLELEVTSCFSL